MWRARAACREQSNDVFFDPAYAEEARLICEGCTVRLECLEYARATESVGVWGGTLSAERGLQAIEKIKDETTRDTFKVRTMVFKVTHDGFM